MQHCHTFWQLQKENFFFLPRVVPRGYDAQHVYDIDARTHDEYKVTQRRERIEGSGKFLRGQLEWMTGQSRLSLSSLFRFIRLSSRSVSLALPERVSTLDRKHLQREREREREANDRDTRSTDGRRRERGKSGCSRSVAAATWLSVALCGSLRLSAATQRDDVH